MGEGHRRCPTAGTFRRISHMNQRLSHAFPLITVLLLCIGSYSTYCLYCLYSLEQWTRPEKRRRKKGWLIMQGRLNGGMFKIYVLFLLNYWFLVKTIKLDLLKGQWATRTKEKSVSGQKNTKSFGFGIIERKSSVFFSWFIQIYVRV